MTINIPKGYEIDKENSTFKNIKFKKLEKSRYLTIYDVWASNEHSLVLPKLASFDGDVRLRDRILDLDSTDAKFAKLVAYAALLDIAEYYNDKWWYTDWRDGYQNKYYITLNKVHLLKDKYIIGCAHLTSIGTVYFQNKEDAQEVIENPNFRKILDVLYQN